MNKKISLLPQSIIFLLGIFVLFLLIKMPQLEGRAQGLNLLQIYSDPLILYVYAASLVFFVGLYKTVKLLGFLGQNHLPDAVSALKSIRLCAVALAVFILAAGVYISQSHHQDDDPAGFLGMCMLLIAINIAVYFLANRYEKQFLHKLQA